MYSWMASWFIGSKETVVHADKDVSTADWTWIEVIKEDNNQEIYIQTSEELRNQHMSCSQNLKKNRGHRAALENLSSLIFSKSLYADAALYSQHKQKYRCISLNLNMCKRKHSLSVTPSKDSFINSCFLLTTINNFAKIIGETSFVQKYRKNSSKADKKKSDFGDGDARSIMRRSYAKWKNEWKSRLLAIEWKKMPLALEWNIASPESIDWKEAVLAIEYKKKVFYIEGKQPLFLEYHSGHQVENNPSLALTDGIQKTELVKIFPKWMQRIDLLEDFPKKKEGNQELPSWMQDIDITLFNSKLQSESVDCWMREEDNDKIPDWLSAIDVYEDNDKIPDWLSAIDVYEINQSPVATHQHHLPDWMKAIDVFKYKSPITNLKLSEENALPEWMVRMNIQVDDNGFNNSLPKTNLLTSLKKTIDVFEIDSCNVKANKKVTAEVPKVVRSLSDNIIGVAVMIAAYATCSNISNEKVSKEQREFGPKKTNQGRQNKTVLSRKMLMRSKSKWLKRRNMIKTISSKRDKRKNDYRGCCRKRSC